MEDTLISFETAKLAKEKKFDILCEHSFSEHNSAIQENNQNGFRNWNKEYKNSYPAPTQSLLTKWLREVHNIEIAIQWFDNCYIKSVKQKPFKANTYRIEGLDNYEEILELGLQEALKLIK